MMTIKEISAYLENPPVAFLWRGVELLAGMLEVVRRLHVPFMTMLSKFGMVHV